MPLTRPRPSGQASPHTKAENLRTAIIVGVVVGTLAAIILTSVIVQRRVNRNTKSGINVRKGSAIDSSETPKNHTDLETGVVQELLPVYQKEPKEDEKRLAISDHGIPVDRMA